MICADHHPLDSQNKALWSLHTIFVIYYYLASLEGREESYSFAFQRFMLVHILTDILLNMSLTALR